MRMGNRRRGALCLLAAAVLLLLGITLAGALLTGRAMETDFTRINLSPCPGAWLGTDWMGRDMLSRTLAGLSLSIRIGLIAAAASALLALAVGTAAAAGGWAAAAFSWLIDLVMGIPHILLVMLISMACGRGFWGVTAGVALSHWTALARVVRGEVLQLRRAPYVQAAAKLGAARLDIVRRHLLPHLLPQLLTGLVLLFPHAILHEASVTFLGFGLPAEQPAIGIILSESMGYLTTGRWWLSLFPGLALMGVTALFALLAQRVRQLLDPASVHQ